MKNKYTTIGIVITTILLAAVAIFTAIRLYQTRYQKVTPDDSKASATTVNPGTCIDHSGNRVTVQTDGDRSVACVSDFIPTTPSCPPARSCAKPVCGDGGTVPDGNCGTINCPDMPACAGSTPTPGSQFCTQNAGSCLNLNDVCVTYANGCQQSALCKTPYTSCSSPRPTASSSSCSPKAYFNIVLTDANGNNTGTCKLTTKTFDSNLIACDGSGQTCNQYLQQLSTSTGVNQNAYSNGCYNSIAACQNINGQGSASFRYFFDGTSCVSTNHRYNSQNIDVDDVGNHTCVENLTTNGVAKKVCYTSKSACISDNTTEVIDPPIHSNTCSLSFTISSVATATPTATPTARPTATATTRPTTTATATATATAVPQCNNSCTTNSNCASGLMCYIASESTTGTCRNTQCLPDTDCVCTIATSTSTSIAQAPAPTEQPTLPSAGTTWPTMLATGFGVIVIIGSLLLAL